MSNLDLVGRLKYLRGDVWPYWFVLAWQARCTLSELASAWVKYEYESEAA